MLGKWLKSSLYKTMILKEDKRIIDASGRTLGRVASEVAAVLMGKDRTDFARHVRPSVSVLVKNARRLALTDKKRVQKIYLRHTGYLGGQKKESLKRASEEKGYSEVVRRAVLGMLPKNRLQAESMKNLTIEE
jgi:large subunit ribosomal protein L13